MFETTIFSSFIPQLIMVAAYVTCMFAPKFANEATVFDLSMDTDHQVMVQTSTVDQNIYSSAFHFDHSDYFNPDSSIRYLSACNFFVLLLPHEPDYERQVFYQRLSSRPPPYFC